MAIIRTSSFHRLAVARGRLRFGPDGTLRVERAGIAVVGTTVAEVKAEWDRQFAAMIRRPKADLEGPLAKEAP